MPLPSSWLCTKKDLQLLIAELFIFVGRQRVLFRAELSLYPSKFF